MALREATVLHLAAVGRLAVSARPPVLLAAPRQAVEVGAARRAAGMVPLREVLPVALAPLRLAPLPAVIPEEVT